MSSAGRNQPFVDLTPQPSYLRDAYLVSVLVATISPALAGPLLDRIGELKAKAKSEPLPVIPVTGTDFIIKRRRRSDNTHRKLITANTQSRV